MNLKINQNYARDLFKLNFLFHSIIKKKREEIFHIIKKEFDANLDKDLLDVGTTSSLEEHENHILKNFYDKLNISCLSNLELTSLKEIYPNIKTFIGDARKMNFTDNSFDGCYSHMLYCMAFTYSELENLNTDVCRVLNKDSLNIYTVRNHSDADYKKGTHRGEDLYEMNGYIVHYFSDEKIKKLVKGFKNLSIDHFNEGSFPRKLSLVINQKI